MTHSNDNERGNGRLARGMTQQGEGESYCLRKEEIGGRACDAAPPFYPTAAMYQRTTAADLAFTLLLP